MATVAVTGSGSGIGAALQSRLEKNGDRVIGVDLRNAELEVDLSTPEGRQQAIERVREVSGGKLDRLVVCAGLGPHWEDLAQIASVNYFAAVDLLDGLRADLEGGASPAAVAVCSNSAQFGPFEDHPYVLALLDHDEARARDLASKGDGFLAYGGSKHALSRAIRRRAGEWGAAGIRLNGVAPGTTETPMLRASAEHPIWGKGIELLDIPIGRWAKPAEIAAVIAFLLGQEASYVHGVIVYADGGCDAVTRPDRF